jgi:hypothetical protein
MKTFLLLCAVILNITISLGQTQNSINGAWQMQQDSLTFIWIIADDCYMTVAFSTSGNRFISATGGKLKTMEKSLELTVEFNSINKEGVGTLQLLDFKLDKDKLITRHPDNVETWKRIDDGLPGALAGAWLFSGRKAKPEDEIAPYTPGARKTMKILSGTRFQWAAFNTETKEFFGTGGGTYTTQAGRYTENIDVFSRDNARVGASLSFDMEVAEPHWNHSGKSSKGDPIFERWSRRKSFAGQ